MRPAHVPLLMFGIFGIVIVLMAWVAHRQGKKAAENLRQLADSLGLQFFEPARVLGLFYTGAKAAGSRGGKQVEAFSFWTGSGKSRVQWSAVSAAVPVPVALTFHLRRQNIGSSFLALFGAKEIEIGDAEFDRAWYIQTNQPEFLREALLPELRAKISSLLRELGASARGIEFKLEENRVRYAELGSFSNGDLCQRCLRATDIVCDLVDVAEVFAEQPPGR